MQESLGAKKEGLWRDYYVKNHKILSISLIVTNPRQLKFIFHYEYYNFAYSQLLKILDLNNFGSLEASVNTFYYTTLNFDELSIFKEFE